MLVINDAEIVHGIEAIARRENRTVEDVLKSMLEQYPAESATAAESEPSEAVKRVRRKIYGIARRRWKELGDEAKAALTDEELDEQFGVFDEEGIPRLKSELTTLEPPPGSLAYAAKIFEEADFHSGDPDLARRSKQILDEHFAEDYLKRMRDQDAVE